ncbi:MAG: Ig-like domain-containing protein, partial [Candidatus Latescibacterota bacterium]
MALAPNGDLYIADSGNHRIIRVNISGFAFRIAGQTSLPAFAGDGGPSVSASLNNPTGLTFDDNGDLFVADQGNHRIRKIDFGTNDITTFAGDGTTGVLNAPSAIAFGESGDLWIIESGANALSKRNSSNVISQAITGLTTPNGLTIDGAGNIYYSNSGGHQVFKIGAASQTSTVLVGTGGAGFGGDGGLGSSAQINSPQGLAVGTSGHLYIADYGNNRVRKVLGVAESTPGVFVTSASPDAADPSVSIDANIVLNFNHAMNAPYNGSIVVHGSLSGVRSGVVTGGTTNVLTFDPVNDFLPGEEIHVSATSALTDTGSVALGKPEVWTFTANTGDGPANFNDVTLDYVT